MTNAKRKSLVSILVFSLLLPTIFAIAPQTAFGITLLHEFAGGANDGPNPFGSLTLSGSTLYGMLTYGGDNNTGVVFEVNTDGTGYNLLHEFMGGADDGSGPQGSPTLSGSTLYGVTRGGGDNNTGVVFEVNADGSGFGLLKEFSSGSEDGYYPQGSPTLSGSTLYGMTSVSRDYHGGMVFKMNTDGTGYDPLHEFSGGANDGYYPYYGSLILSGSTLYGMTYSGGDNDRGVVFKINTDGTGFGLLHEFGGTGDGGNPRGSLTLSGSTLYGMTENGGDYGDGVVFKVNTNGTGYDLLHEFGGGPNDGDSPWGSLTLSGSTLYGMTQDGGGDNIGVVFKVNTDGTGYDHLHEFDLDINDGNTPYGSLTLSGSTLYGMTLHGGDHGGGVVFALDLISPPVADFSFDIDPVGTGKPDIYPVMHRCQSVYFTDLSENMGTVDDEWLWEILDATDHSTVVASSILQNPEFTWPELANYFPNPLDDHWYDVRLTVTNSETSDSITREFLFMTVPEPGTLLLLAPALLGFAGLLRRRLR